MGFAKQSPLEGLSRGVPNRANLFKAFASEVLQKGDINQLAVGDKTYRRSTGQGFPPGNEQRHTAQLQRVLQGSIATSTFLHVHARPGQGSGLGHAHFTQLPLPGKVVKLVGWDRWLASTADSDSDANGIQDTDADLLWTCVLETKFR